jgi:outer membrane protein assembly factor BamB
MSTISKIRWWPAVAILVLAAGALVWNATRGGVSGQDRVMTGGFLLLPLTLFLLFLWFFFLSRLRWRIRLAGLGLAVLAVGLFIALVRIRGVSGNLVPVLEWRWASELGAVEATGGDVDIAASPDDYPQFLGPRRNATLPDVRLVGEWSSDPPREVWRREVGAGWSSFAVVGEIAVTQEQRGEEEAVVAYALKTGEPLWYQAEATRYASTIGGVGPRATPTIYDGRVYTVGATGRFNAFDLATGERLWSHDLTEFGGKMPEWGVAVSPLIVGNVVVVVAGGPDGHSLVAYDRIDGDRVWSAGDDASSYSSPLLVDLAGKRQIVTLHQGHVVGRDATDGTELWRQEWPSQQPNVAQPVPLPGDRLLVSAGYGIGASLFQLQATEAGGVDATVLWQSPRLKLKFTQAVLHEGHLYGLDDGVLVSLDPETGERNWKRGRYGHGQILLVGDRLLVLTEGGELVLVDPTPEEHRELHTLQVLPGKTWNTPALAGRYLLVRNDKEAACYELAVERVATETPAEASAEAGEASAPADPAEALTPEPAPEGVAD